MASTRTAPQRAYVLHSYPYKESSLILDVLSVAQGRLALVAKGAKRPGSNLRPVLLSLQPLELAWSGRGEVRTLVSAQWLPGQPWLTGQALLCGLYLNELLIKLLPREDPHPELFEAYAAAVMTLAEAPNADEQAAVLREFELILLRELGYALELQRDVATGLAIDPEREYRYDPERGPSLHGPGEAVSGAVLLALAKGRFEERELAQQARHFLRWVIDRHLERRRLRSSAVAEDLRELALRAEQPRRRSSKRELAA